MIYPDLRNGVAPVPDETTLSQLRTNLSRIWPMGSQANMLKRELALLLLEDPQQRLRLAHCDEIMRCRLPGVYVTSPTHLLGGQGGAVSPIHTTISQDPSCQLIFRLDRSSSACEGVDAWRHAVLHLDVKQLVDRCGCSAAAAPGGPAAGPGVIAAAVANSPVHPSLSCGLGASPTTPGGRLPSSPPAAPAAGWVLGSVEASLLRAVSATWPQAAVDDEAYLAAAMGVVLVCRQEPSLPPCSLALSEVQAGLSCLGAADARLRPRAAALESSSSKKPGPGRASAGRFQELLAQPRFKGLLKMRDSASRRGDKVLSLCVDKLAAPAGQPPPEHQLLPPHVLTWAGLLAAMGSPSPASDGPVSGSSSPSPSDAHCATPLLLPPQASPSPGLPKFLFEYEAAEPHFPGHAGAKVLFPVACRPAPQQQQPQQLQRDPAHEQGHDRNQGRQSFSGYREQSFNGQSQSQSQERQSSSGYSRQPLANPLELEPAFGSYDQRVFNGYRQESFNGHVEQGFRGQQGQGQAQGFLGYTERGFGGYGYPLQSFSAAAGEEEGAGGCGQLLGSPEEYLVGDMHDVPLAPEQYRRALRQYGRPGMDNQLCVQVHGQQLPEAGGYGFGGVDGMGPIERTPSSASAPGLVACSPASTGGPGASSLFSTSPNVLQHVPREVASCWGAGEEVRGGPAAGSGSGVARTVSGGAAPGMWDSGSCKSAEAHGGAGAGAGGGVGGTPPRSPPSALDAACMALLAGSSLGSRDSGGAQLEHVFWPSTSPEAGAAPRSAACAAAGAAGRQYVVAAHLSKDTAAAAAAGTPPTAVPERARRPSAPNANANGHHAAASSTSDGSEDCGVHGPPDIETTLEAIISFDPLDLSLLSSSGAARYGASPYAPNPAVQLGQPSLQGKSFAAAASGGSAVGCGPPGHPHMGAAYAALEPSAGSRGRGEPPPLLQPDAFPGPPGVRASAPSHGSSGNGNGGSAAGRAAMTGWAAVAAMDPHGVRPPAHQQQQPDAPDTAVAAAAAWKQAASGSGPGAPSLHMNGFPGPGFPASPSTLVPPPQPPCSLAYRPTGPSPTGAPTAAPQAPPAPGGPPAPPPRLDQKLFPKTPQWLRDEIMQLLRTVPGLKAEDFDEGVLHQLEQKRSEEEARAALRTLLGSDVTMLQHPAAYLNHVIKNFRSGAGNGAAGGESLGAPSLPSATVRANSVAVSSKAILQRLPLRLYRRLEDIVNRCDHLEWKHFDAGVVKVLSQLSELSDDDVVEELELLQATDLSAVEYMPAYLNKRLNNRLWSKRKQRQQQQQMQGGGAR